MAHWQVALLVHAAAVSTSASAGE